MYRNPDNQESTPQSLTGQRLKTIQGWVCPNCGLTLSPTTGVCPQDGTPIQDGFEAETDKALSDRYEFLEVIGSGGMSVIYKARQRMLNKLVAIKMLHSHIMGDSSVVRFQQEAKAATSLQHRNVIRVYDFGLSEQGAPYMVMDFIDGPTLADLLLERGALPLPEALEIFAQVCAALEHAHDNGVLHRDLKPSNIMLIITNNGYDVRLVDFGIAKITEGDSVAHQLTQTGELFGSPFYMSPEQCMSRPMDARSDIYSLGCILYEMLVGRPPHRGETMIETIFKHLNDTPQPLDQACPNIVFPDAVRDLVNKLLAKKAELRYQNMHEVIDKLDNIQAGVLSSEPESPLNERFKFGINFGKEKIALIFALAFAIYGTAAMFVASSKVSDAQKIISARPSELDVRSTKERADSYVYHTLLTEMDPSKINDQNLIVWLPKLGDVTALNLSNSQISDQIMPSIAQLRLIELRLSSTKISDASLPNIARISSLQKLSISNTSVSARALQYLTVLRNLVELRVSETSVSDDDVKGLAVLPSLKELEARHCAIGDASMQYLSSTKNLSNLDVRGSNVSDQGLAALLANHLEQLNIGQTKISAAGLKNLAQMRTLKQLAVCRLPFDDGAADALKSLPRLVNLNASDTKITDKGVESLAAVKSLQSINLTRCNITDASSSSFMKMPNLGNVTLIDTKISDQTLKMLSKHPNLHSFHVADNAQLTDAGFSALAQNSGLREVAATGTKITDQGLLKFANCPTLRKISVWNCRGITPKGISELKRKNPNCEVDGPEN